LRASYAVFRGDAGYDNPQPTAIALFQQCKRESCVMSKCVGFLKQLGRDEEGTALIEYTILLGLIAMATITTAILVGNWVSGHWTTLCANLNSISAGCS
jgi:pilus assembly protein Flp/PilA